MFAPMLRGGVRGREVAVQGIGWHDILCRILQMSAVAAILCSCPIVRD